MKITLYERKESLETIILGINRDPKRHNFHEIIQRIPNLELQKEIMDEGVLKMDVEGDIFEFDTYPDAAALHEIFNFDDALLKDVQIESDLLHAANTTRLGACCGVGEDVYLDPNEDC